MEKQLGLTIVLISLLLLTLPIKVGSWTYNDGIPEDTKIEISIAEGLLGSQLYYRMYSPQILKIRTNTTINFIFIAQRDIFIEFISIGAWGEAFKPLPQPVINKLVASNVLLNDTESINYSMPLEPKPLTEGIVVIRVGAHYNFTEGSDYNYQEIKIPAKALTYDELYEKKQFSEIMAIGLGLTTVTSLASFAVFVSKKKEKT